MPRYQIKTLVVHTHEVEADSIKAAALQTQPLMRRDKAGHPDTVKLLSIEPIIEVIPEPA